MEEAAVSNHPALAYGSQRDESHVCRVANGALVLGRNIVAAEEYPPPLEVLCVPAILRSDGKEPHAGEGDGKHHLQGAQDSVRP